MSALEPNHCNETKWQMSFLQLNTIRNFYFRRRETNASTWSQ